MNKNLSISTLINEKEEELEEWKIYLKKELSNNSYKEIDLFLIDKRWLDKYESIKLNKSLKKKLYNNLESINNDRFLKNLSESSHYSYLPPLFVLNKNIWDSFQNDFTNSKMIQMKGQFLNNLLILDMKDIIKKIKIYCIYFLDNEENLRQGYIEIKNPNIKMKDFENLIKEKEKKINYGICNFQEKYYNLFIFKYKKQNNINALNYNSCESPKIKKLKNNINKYNNNNNNNKLNEIKEQEKEIKYKFTKKLSEDIYLRNSKFNLNKRINNNEFIEEPILSKKFNSSEITKTFKFFKFNDNNNNINNNKENLKKPIELHNKEKEKNNKIKYSKNNIPKINNRKKKLKNEDYLIFNPKRNIKKNLNFHIRGGSADLKEKNNKRSKFYLKEGKLDLEEFLPKRAFHKQSSPGIIGLENINDSSYINVTLQFFSNIIRLRVYLLSKDVYQDLEKNKTNKKLSFALAEVLKNLWQKLDNRLYSPKNFKKLNDEINLLYKRKDPKDLILLILETLHKELNNPLNFYRNNNDIDLNDFEDVFNNFLFAYISKNNSIISNEFYGFINNMTICNNCKTIIHNVQVINILSFPLEEVRKFINYKHNNVRINDCFEYYQKYDERPPFFCNNCQQNYKAYKQTKLIYAPKTLIINLISGKGSELNINIIFEEYLNIKKYIIDVNSPYYYELIGVICHDESINNIGNYIAFFKNSNNCEWYKYNDQIVTKCSFNEVKRTRLPYILVFSYINV